jgi:hypothetical protein
MVVMRYRTGSIVFSIKFCVRIRRVHHLGLVLAVVSGVRERFVRNLSHRLGHVLLRAKWVLLQSPCRFWCSSHAATRDGDATSPGKPKDSGHTLTPGPVREPCPVSAPFTGAVAQSTVGASTALA